jgi:DNA invertase Pin-like site-specific DNA recombinase
MEGTEMTAKKAKKAKAKADNKPLRFAALIRVSTERQAQQGESLRTQTGQIERAVESLGGEVAMKFAAQEHATEGWERAQLDKLLADAQKARKPFDAVIVADPSRWSRDNVRSEEGLKILRDSGVRFFVLTTEYDLFEPQALLFLGMNSLIGAFQAREQKRKSLLNRIARAQRGVPTSGGLPFGRTYDRVKHVWGIDPEKQKLVRDVAKRYVDGGSLRELAKEFGINYSFLCETLGKNCGGKWEVRYKAKDLNIDEVVTMTVPRLLPEKVIKLVRKRMDINRTYMHGSPENRDYLLRGRVFCAECGGALTGMTRRDRFSYYAHARESRMAGTCSLHPRPHVRVDKLDALVVNALFKLFGNPAALERAVKAAVPDADKTAQARERLKADLGKIEKARGRVLTLIEKDALTDEQAESKLLDLKAREEKMRAELERLDASASNLPEGEALRQLVLHVMKVGDDVVVHDAEGNFEDRHGNRYRGGNGLTDFLDMSDEEKRALIAKAFSGLMPDGKPAGVYVRVTGGGPHRPKTVSYVLRGVLIAAAQSAMMSARPGPTRSRIITTK